MMVYWAMFVIALLGVMAPKRLPRRQSLLVMGVVGLLFSIIIGLRHQVGGDWDAYEQQFYDFSAALALSDFVFGDPAYYGIGWGVAALGGGIHGLNFICALILMCGVVAFCRAQPNPWLALLIAIPYLLIVVGMGYTRQATAIGLVLLAMVALGEGSRKRFVLLIMLAAAFHKTAVMMIPVVALAAHGSRLWNFTWATIAGLIAYGLFLMPSQDALVSAYIVSDYAMVSEGASLRAAMNAIPAAIFLLLREKFLLDKKMQAMWTIIAVIALLSLPMSFFFDTVTDRLMLYLIPLQLFVFSRLPSLFRTSFVRGLITVSICMIYALALAVWLTSADHAFLWVPYRFWPGLN